MWKNPLWPNPNLYQKKGWEKKANESFAKAIQVDPLMEVEKKTDVNKAYSEYGKVSPAPKPKKKK